MDARIILARHCGNEASAVRQRNGTQNVCWSCFCCCCFFYSLNRKASHSFHSNILQKIWQLKPIEIGSNQVGFWRVCAYSCWFYLLILFYCCCCVSIAHYFSSLRSICCMYLCRHLNCGECAKMQSLSVWFC